MSALVEYGAGASGEKRDATLLISLLLWTQCPRDAAAGAFFYWLPSPASAASGFGSKRERPAASKR
jgi:hypothetical protein